MIHNFIRIVLKRDKILEQFSNFFKKQYLLSERKNVKVSYLAKKTHEIATLMV